MLTDQQIGRLKELISTDMGVTEIAAELGLSYHTFRVRLAESGLKIRRVLVDEARERARREALEIEPGTLIHSVDEFGRRYQFIYPDGKRDYGKPTASAPASPAEEPVAA